jgi:hypothetical protein
MSDEQPQRPTTDDRDAWPAYSTVQGMPWRVGSSQEVDGQVNEEPG